MDFTRKTSFNEYKLNWALIGPKGAMHLWVRTNFSRCGMEQHSQSPLHDNGCAVKHDECWIFNTPCWHDGTSSLWDDGMTAIVGSLEAKDDSPIWAMLREWYDAKFGA